jgi:hypothetical protein
MALGRVEHLSGPASIATRGHLAGSAPGRGCLTSTGRIDWLAELDDAAGVVRERAAVPHQGKARPGL